MKTIRSVALVVVMGVAALAGCNVSDPSIAPNPSIAPSAVAAKPAVQIDQTWQAANGRWTISGFVDPRDDPTDVVLEVGPGPATARQFDRQIGVAQGLTDAGPVTVTTREIPDIDEICVRLTATNNAGRSSSSPLCFPHDLPSFVVGSSPP